MPADYKEITIPVNGVKAWNRFGSVHIYNPYGGTPTVLCVEQRVEVIGDRVRTEDIGNLGFTFDPSESFPVLNPVTMEPTGEMMTGTELYTAIFSAVMHQAALRDAALEAQAQPQPEPAPEPGE